MGINASGGQSFLSVLNASLHKRSYTWSNRLLPATPGNSILGIIMGWLVPGAGPRMGLIVCHENLRAHHTTPSSLITMFCETSVLTSVSF